MDYSDPKNKQDILDRLHNLPTLKEVKVLVDEIFPNWITGYFDRYSDDYPNLNKNWKHICDLSNSKPTKILIVEEINFTDNYTLIRTFCELLTRSGFSVRRKGEFIPCQICGEALPSKQLHELMLEKVPDIPIIWSQKCSKH